MADTSMKSAVPVFGLGRTGTGHSESTEGPSGHPLAMVTDVRRHDPNRAARTLPGLAPAATPSLD